MFKNKIKLMSIILLILLILSISLIMLIKNNYENKPMFLLYESNINTSIDDEVFLNLIFVDNKNSNIVKNFNKGLKSIKFDDMDNIEVIDYQVDKGNNFNNISLYNLFLKVKFKQAENGHFNNLTLEYNNYINKFKIGNWHYNVTKNKNVKALKITSNISIASNLKKYIITAKNIYDKEIIINKLICNNFEQYINDISISVNNIKTNKNNNITLSPNDSVEIKISFNDIGNKDLYIFSPLIECYVEGEIESYSPLNTLYGLPLNENKINQIYKKYCNEY